VYSCLDRLFRHLAWADQEILAALDQPPPIEPALKLFAHIVAAEQIWLSRIHSQDSRGLTPWSPLSIPECRELSARAAAAYRELISAQSEQGLDELVTYRTTKGDEFRTPLGDILLHIALHGSYHRGQIASILRSQGRSVPATDFVIFSRQIDADPGHS
jgi:uncharacterized damage-inducible protein DinB